MVGFPWEGSYPALIDCCHGRLEGVPALSPASSQWCVACKHPDTWSPLLIGNMSNMLQDRRPFIHLLEFIHHISLCNNIS